MAEEEYETWQANGRIVLRKYNRAGTLEEVMVNTNRRIQLTAAERMMNQDRVVDEKMDPFANGTLSPVRLPESSKASTQAIVSSPNTITEDDMLTALTGHHKTFEKKITEISSPYVLRRMLAMAREDDMDISIKRVEALETRLREVTTGDVPVVEHTQI